MQVTRNIIINAPLDKVWEVAAHDFDKVDEWSSGVSFSDIATGGQKTEEAEMAGRVCMTAAGKCYEIFEIYDEQQHMFTYEGLFEKTPPGLVSAHNTWTAEAISDTQARLTMSVEMRLNIFPGSFMRIPMRLQVPRILDMNLEEIKHYIETDRPHPRKLAAIRKVAKSNLSSSTS